jgi:hypothetical protein
MGTRIQQLRGGGANLIFIDSHGVQAYRNDSVADVRAVDTSEPPGRAQHRWCHFEPVFQ